MTGTRQYIIKPLTRQAKKLGLEGTFVALHDLIMKTVPIVLFYDVKQGQKGTYNLIVTSRLDKGYDHSKLLTGLTQAGLAIV